MIKNGRPYTNENGYVDADLITDHHSEEEIEEICKWIKSTLIPGKLFNFNYSSYSLKHILECDTGIYLTNNEFKDAMQKCGFKPDNPNDLNWCYRISNNSPALNEHDYADDGKITKHHSEKEGIFNYIADQTGFTLNDLVSYDAKHNEENGENNQDGPDYNFSWNCGAEGPSRKRAVTELRKHQIRNAFFLVLLAQGTPCILAGDEFGNTQKGNNNVYCQDNPTGWTDWRGLEKKKDLYEFVKKLIAFRKNHPILIPEREVQGIDLSCCGVPDVSYHGEEAWQVPGEVSSRQLGVYYSGAQTKSADCYVAYNMHWLTHTFALPALPKEYGWDVKATTQDGIMNEPKLLKNQRKVELKERTVAVLTADRIVEAKVKKNESNTTSKDHKSS